MHELFEKGKISHKPILLIVSDVASDEAPQFPKTLPAAVSLFKELQLDAILHGVNASGLSAFNPVERRMAPLSHDIAGVILPHDHFGNHLGSNGETIDRDLQKKNSQKATEILANVWSNTVTDGHKVDAQAMPIGMARKLDEVDAEWVSKHVQQTRYSLQIVKCLRSECCSQFQTNWLEVFPKRFLPTPAYTVRGKCAVEPDITTKNPNQYLFAPLQD